MTYFNKRTIYFLKELPENNNKIWFNKNKEQFKQEVKIPFKSFISDVIIELQTYIPDLNIDAKDCIFRIYRDVRFSKDKSPYKNHISAMISKGGRKDRTTPGLYIEFSANEIRILSGCFELRPIEIEKIRNYISKNLSEFDSLVNDTNFTNTFGEIRGEKYKKIPSKYQVNIKSQPLLLNKSLYYLKKYDIDLALKVDLLETLISDFQNCLQLNMFFLKALGN